MAKKSGIPGLSFSWKRATGITAAKRGIAKATGIPTTKSGRQRKFHVSLGGGSRRRSPGSGSRTSSSGGGCSWGLIKWLLVIILVVGGGMNIKESPVAAVISVALGLLLAGWPLIAMAIPALREKRAEGKADAFSFYVLPPDDEASQEKLRACKLDASTHDVSLQVEDSTGAVTVLLDQAPIGVPVEAAADWLRGNFSAVAAVDSAVVIGGGHTPEGEPRPFTLAVGVKLRKPMVCPEKGEVPLPPVRDAFGFPGDRVCVLTKTGKAHTCPPGCGVGSAGLPHLLLDDLDPEKHSLCLKCYKDYF